MKVAPAPIASDLSFDGPSDVGRVHTHNRTLHAMHQFAPHYTDTVCSTPERMTLFPGVLVKITL
jgi:hypothetical protein